MDTDFVLDALEQALHARQPEQADALVETINGLYKTRQSQDKTEPIYKHAPWKTREAVELAMLKWVA